MKTLYINMDNVLVDFKTALNKVDKKLSPEFDRIMKFKQKNYTKSLKQDVLFFKIISSLIFVSLLHL